MACWECMKKDLGQNNSSIVDQLVDLQEKHEFPSKEDFKTVGIFSLGGSEDDDTNRFMYMRNVTRLTMPLICQFAKRIPLFGLISEQCLISLLKASYSELLMLRAARRYDPQTESIVFANGLPYTRQNYRSALMGNYTDSLFEFCKTMWDMRIDNGQYALLTVIVMLSSCPESEMNIRNVKELRDLYIDILRAYCANSLATDKELFDRWLNSIFEKLDCVGLKRSENTFSILVKTQTLHPHIKSFLGPLLCYPIYECGNKQSLSAEQEACIFKLAIQQAKRPPKEELDRVTPFASGDSEEDSMKRKQHMTDMTELTVQQIVDFAKKIPQFALLTPNDQMVLLQACFFEVLVLWASSRYHPETDSIVFSNDLPYTKENFTCVWREDYVQSIFDFCRVMFDLRVDNGEHAILTAMVIFSVRPNLHEPEKVAEHLEIYNDILERYISKRRRETDDRFKMLLFTRPFVLRKLGKINQQQYRSLKAQNVNFSPVLGGLLN